MHCSGISIKPDSYFSIIIISELARKKLPTTPSLALLSGYFCFPITLICGVKGE